MIPLRPALLACLSAAFALVGAASAQETDTDLYDGTWDVRIQAPGQPARTARLTIADYAGHWQELNVKRAHVAAADRPCAGRKLPLTVQASRPSALEFTVFGSSLNPGCSDFGIALKPVDATRLTGSLGEAQVMLSRRRR